MKARTIRRIFLVFILFLGLIILWIGGFFIINEAPILKGEIIYNIKFKEGKALDIYAPTKSIYKKAPIVLFIHGGAWIAGRKESININRFNDAINKLRDSGYVVISTEYTLANTDHSAFPDCVLDVYDAHQWIVENADSLRFDLNNYGVFGESAGAHLAMLLAYADPSNFNIEGSIPDLKYVVNIYGPTNLFGIYFNKKIDSVNAIIDELPDYISSRLDITKQIFGFDPKDDSIRAVNMMQLYSPINYVSESSPPTLIIQGDKDQVVPLSQSFELIEMLNKNSVINESHILKGSDHAFIGATDLQKENTQNWIVSFIQKSYSTN